MWYDVFFDTDGVFQWASIAAIVSFIALCSTIVSIVLTHRQSAKNRKSSTLVNLRIEELKDLREEASKLISLINKFLKERSTINGSGVTAISNRDPLIKKMDEHFDKIYAKLYRETNHGTTLSLVIATNKARLLTLTSTQILVDISIELDKSFKAYSKIEYANIEKYI